MFKLNLKRNHYTVPQY